MLNSNLKVPKKVPRKVLEKVLENHQRKGDDHLENETVPDLPRNHQQSLIPSKRARRSGAKSNQMFAQDLSKPRLTPDQDPNQGRKLSENLTLTHYQSRHGQHGRGRQKHLQESCPRPNPDQHLNLPSRKSKVLKNDRSVERGDQKVLGNQDKRIMFMNQNRQYGWSRRLRGGKFLGPRTTC